jgi:hypothetical protein
MACEELVAGCFAGDRAPFGLRDIEGKKEIMLRKVKSR